MKNEELTAMMPEEKARQEIDQLLLAAGWQVQDYSDLNLGASIGIAVREFPLTTGFADYPFPLTGKLSGPSRQRQKGPH